MTTWLELARRLRFIAGAALAGLLIACSSPPSAPKPADLGPDPALLGVRLAWSAQIGPLSYPLSLTALDHAVVLASDDGTLSAHEIASGATLWQTSVGAPIDAGIGSDGRRVSLVTRGNELMTFEGGRQLWRAHLSAQVLTPPLVAGERVFVLAGDRSVTAYDARSGRKLWSEQHPGDALVLRQAGILSAVNNTLVFGLAGRLVGLDPNSGQTLWSATIASPRGTNDVERMVDLVSGLGRNGNVICARAFQAALGCVDAVQGRLIWREASVGTTGLHSDADRIYGVESDGRVVARKMADGQVAWSTDVLRYRQLSAPLVLGRSVVLGDEVGNVHFLSRTDGSVLKRLSTDGSAIASTPLVVGNTLIVVTRKGGVFGFRPE